MAKDLRLYLVHGARATRFTGDVWAEPVLATGAGVTVDTASDASVRSPS